MKMTIAAIAAAVLLSACAQSPSSIQPVAMVGAYSGVPCSTARAHLQAERANLATLSQSQNAAVAGDAIGVLLIGVPVSSLGGGDRAGDIATAKGKIVALEAKLGGC